jgi:predicted AAA+ superfamily ATPase
MAISNYDRVGKALELLKTGLQPYVEREMKAQHEQLWLQQARAAVAETQAHLFSGGGEPEWDAAALLAVMWNQWEAVFKKTLGRAERSLISELREIRNKWAHQKPFSSDDAYRALDSAARLLSAVVAPPQVEELEKLKTDLLRVRFDEQVRSEKRRTAETAIESQSDATLKSWREVVNPHKDVQSGNYNQAEFAADLWQVYLGEGSDEYRKPEEFFRRTYLTVSLKELLVGAVRRLAGQNGDPVVQLQTNFGGGKTHSMLALFHLFSDVPAQGLLGIDEVLAEAGVSKPLKVNRVVLVGNKISPGNPVTKSDGTVVRTLWGELAWQLGFGRGGIKEAKKAFSRIAADDELATSPGDVLRELMNEYGPSLILIDEWVAYARQLHDNRDLPGGDFETHFSFAQALTESAKAAKQCLLVISLPASDTTGSPHAIADDVEVGGTRGRQALDRLRNAVGRVEASWRPASAEEGFEIVRRRLFEPLSTDSYVARDTVARAFVEMYRKEKSEFPPECSEGEYEKRLKAAYPIHPEIFDRLYSDWSTLVKFQRTRGVLRLMAAVIHSLWEQGDRSALILPASIPISDRRVQFELTRYLSDQWVPVIEKDVDGGNSLPLRIDGEIANLGKYSATRRVARAIYLGSAPIDKAANKGIEDRRIKLGSVFPGETPAVFGDALRRLASRATYLYQDGPRYWYSTQPTVTKLAEDRAEQLKRDQDKIVAELDTRLRGNLAKVGDFYRVHRLPATSGDVPDNLEASLVVLSIDQAYSKEANNPAELAARSIFENRGNAPRLYRNSLVFLAADKSRVQDLEEAICKFLAWDSILKESEELNLTQHQITQAKTQRQAADGVVHARLPEMYQWLIVPTQENPQAQIAWQAMKLSGTDALADRASKKLKPDFLVSSLAPTILRMELDRVPLWRGGNHVAIRQLVEDFGRYLYLPRLRDGAVLLNAIRSGLSLLTWEKDSFAYADSFDEEAGRYRGLRQNAIIPVTQDDSGLLVKPEAARLQIDSETKPEAPAATKNGSGEKADEQTPSPTSTPSDDADQKRPKRYHGTVKLDSARVGRDAGRIADEIISHLVGLVGSNVSVTLEIEAQMPQGTPDHVVRTVTENGRTLKFQPNSGFESD